MQGQTATAIANPNIAFIKYWGDRDSRLHIPANGSISMNLEGLSTHTQVTFDASFRHDQLILDGRNTTGAPLRRVSDFLDRVRRLAGWYWNARVVTTNNFPIAAGLASSASAFSALALAASAAMGLQLSERDLSRLARLGSGSACRSVPGGFVEWQPGRDDFDSYAFSIAPASHWDLADCIAIVNRGQKVIGSTEGHMLAETSPLQNPRISDTPLRLQLCRQAISQRDFDILANVTELDCQLMHAVMITSTPPLLYWQPATQLLARTVQAWRKAGQPVCYTTDAGPNVHVLCPSSYITEMTDQLMQVPGVSKVLVARPGGPARLEK
jgi:diphosphomevalonate decarboxylase